MTADTQRIGLRGVLFPCESDTSSPIAFAHALRIALDARCHFGVLQALGDRSYVANWRDAPAVRELLERWQLLPSGSARADVAQKLGISVEKVIFEGQDPVRAIESYNAHHPADLVVLATEGRTGLPRWLSPSIAEAIARTLQVPALFVPDAARGFVDPNSGAISLERVLIPVDHVPDPTPAIDAVRELLTTLGVTTGRLTVLHVGDDPSAVPARPASQTGYQLVGITRRGEPAETIVATARERDSDLVVMATAGRDGVLDVIRGSVSERVLRESPCPVLTVPSR